MSYKSATENFFLNVKKLAYTQKIHCARKFPALGIHKEKLTSKQRKISKFQEDQDRLGRSSYHCI